MDFIEYQDVVPEHEAVERPSKKLTFAAEDPYKYWDPLNSPGRWSFLLVAMKLQAGNLLA